MLESEEESDGRENMVSKVDLSLVKVDRWTWVRAPGQNSSLSEETQEGVKVVP